MRSCSRNRGLGVVGRSMRDHIIDLISDNYIFHLILKRLKIFNNNLLVFVEICQKKASISYRHRSYWALVCVSLMLDSLLEFFDHGIEDLTLAGNLGRGYNIVLFTLSDLEGG